MCVYVCCSCNFALLLGTYHQYDTIAYPKKTKVAKTWAEKAKATMAAIGGLFGLGQTSRSTESGKELELKPLSESSTMRFSRGTESQTNYVRIKGLSELR